MNNIAEVEEKIKEYHGGDDTQMKIILSPKRRLIVEAPAGCGKTTTMVSKVAYMFAKEDIPVNKKILALTFSVNAAYKMKKDISEKLPNYGITDKSGPNELNKRIYISNYHGLCRRIISLYGYLLDERLREIVNFKALNECDIHAEEMFAEYGVDVSEDEKKFFALYNTAILNCDEQMVDGLEDRYIGILKTKFFERKCITYNAYLILARRLLAENKELLEFYHKLYHTIIIDEFQDTNYLSWRLVCMLVSDFTNLFFMGDSLQRIYGFIGAIPKLMDIAENKFSMYRIEMTKNYRFQSNTQMLYLDRNIRENARNPLNPAIAKTAEIKLHYTNSQSKECNWVVSKIIDVQNEKPDETTAIIVQQRGNGINSIMEKMDDANVDYFYALFSEDDDEYILFHKRALSFFYDEINKSPYGRINKTFLKRVYKKVESYYTEKNKLVASLLELTKVFFARVSSEYVFLDNQDKIALIADAFENRALKQNMDLIQSKLFVTTVHGAKGLEWDNVFIPDIEPFCFPNFLSLCKECCDKAANYSNKDSCRIDVNKISRKSFLEELSVFYVAVTRVRKQLLFSASMERYNAKGKQCSSKISCMLFLPGISIKQI